MNKKAFLEQTYNSAFQDELEKISSEDTGNHALTGAAILGGANAASIVTGTALSATKAGKKKKVRDYKLMRRFGFNKNTTKNLIKPSIARRLGYGALGTGIAGALGYGVGSLFDKK